MSRLNESRSLPVELTESEYKVRASELASATQKLDALKRYHSEEKKEMKAAEDKLATEIAILAETVADKEECRPVECLWTPHYNRGVWICSRSDTGEEVAVEPMTKAHRQQEFGYGNVSALRPSEGGIDPETGEVNEDGS